METTNLTTTDYSYKVSGEFDPATQNMQLCLYIEEGTEYIASPVYNFSQMTGNQSSINIIAIFITKDNDEGKPFGAQSGNYPLKLYPHRLAPFYDSVLFDFSKDDALVILFHDKEFKKDDVETIYRKAEYYYNEVRKDPDGFILIDVDNCPPLTPRKAGLSLIRRSSRL